MTDIDIQGLKDNQAELKRCISRVSFVGMGLSKELDTNLKSLRDLLKSDADVEAIKQSVEDISKILLTFEDKKSADKIEVAGITDDFSQLINDNRLPKPLKKKLKSVKGPSEEESAVKIARSMVDIIFDYLHRQSLTESGDNKENKSASPGGFFSRFLSRSNGEAAPTDTPAQAAKAEAKKAEVPSELRDSLQQLIDQLSAMENYSEVALQLTEKVVVLSSVDELVAILELITGAFVEISTHEHQQLENFLKSLSKRIDRVNGFVNQTMAFSKQVSEDTKRLDDKLQGSVTDIKASVEKSASLGEVKVELYQKMDSIIDAVNYFRAQQQKNQQKLNRDIETLHEQLRATHDESSRLRDELAAQRVRAQTDPLTHLPNRYSYNERLTLEYNRWRRYRSPLSLVVGDIDLFKQINDTYGHAAGDEVLKAVANALQSALRESDFVARYGGEEFVILLPETTLVDATKAMNKIRKGIKALSVKHDASTITTAMSFGISEFENSDTPKAVFARADRALYRAKERGRDQVCCQRAKAKNE